MGWQQWHYRWDSPAPVEEVQAAVLTGLGPLVQRYGFELQAHSPSAIIYARRYTPWLNQLLEFKADNLLEVVALDMDKSKDSIAIALVSHGGKTLITVQSNTGLRLRKALETFFADDFPRLVAPRAVALAHGLTLCMRCEDVTNAKPLCDACEQTLRLLAQANSRSALLEALLPAAVRLNRDGDLSVIRTLYTDDYACELRPSGRRMDLAGVMEAVAKATMTIKITRSDYSSSIDDGRHAWVVSRVDAEAQGQMTTWLTLERHALREGRVYHSLLWRDVTEDIVPMAPPVVPTLPPISTADSTQ